MLPVINRSFIKLVEQVIDVDGKIKDSAVCSFFLSLCEHSLKMHDPYVKLSSLLFQSSDLRLSRERAQTVERKVSLDCLK